MTVRLFGAAVIAAVSLYTGGACTALWQKRVEVLSAFCRLLSALENGISVMGLPIQGIVLSFSDGILEQTGFLPQVRVIWEQDFCADALTHALSESGIRRWMEEEEYRLLDDFFAQLGSENREREGERCAYIHARLRNLRDEAASDLSARCRIARTLAGAVGCAAALMLL
jgi:stage III sporulation protein AB